MTVNPTPDHIEIKLGGKAYTLFMPYALVNRVARVINGPDNVPFLAGDPETQELVLIEVFTVRDGKDITFRPESLDEIPVSLEDVGRVLDWVSGHILDFFLDQTTRAVKRAERHQRAVASLQRTATGLQNSPSMTPAASPSEPSPPISTP